MSHVVYHEAKYGPFHPQNRKIERVDIFENKPFRSFLTSCAIQIRSSRYLSPPHKWFNRHQLALRYGLVARGFVFEEVHGVAAEPASAVFSS